MSILIRYLTLLVVLALPGCATINVPSNYSLTPKGDKGLVVLSLTHTLSTVIVDYRQKEGETQVDGAFMTGTIQDPMDWDHPKGRLVVAELPAGKYELYQWRSEGFNVTYTSKIFSIPFTVVAGKATYIGNFFVNIDESTSRYRLEVTDKSDRDLPLLIRRYPNIKENGVVQDISKVFR